jgi:hypothetical protein
MVKTLLSYTIGIMVPTITWGQKVAIQLHLSQTLVLANLRLGLTS